MHLKLKRKHKAGYVKVAGSQEEIGFRIVRILCSLERGYFKGVATQCTETMVRACLRQK